MWTANKITADAASKLQVGAGIIVNEFSVKSPTEPADSAIVAETTGDFHITCTPEFKDMFEGINNAKLNTMEGKRVKNWNCALTVSAVSVTEGTLKAALAAADGTAADGIRGRQITTADFKAIYWLADMQEPNKLFVVQMDNAINTNGIDLTATDDGHGAMNLNIVPHVSLKDPETVPMAFYILTKQGAM